jgi:hypothetical protein
MSIKEELIGSIDKEVAEKIIAEIILDVVKALLRRIFKIDLDDGTREITEKDICLDQLIEAYSDALGK